MTFEIFVSLVGKVLLPLVALAYAALAYFWTKRKDRLSFVESAFSDLQSINANALKSNENLLATVQSIWPDASPDLRLARQVYINFFRINRLFRTWNYWKQGVLTKREAFEIIDSHAGVLKSYRDRLDAMLHMGYPPAFRRDLLARVDAANEIPRVWQISENVAANT